MSKRIIDIITEYIPKKKALYVEETHAIRNEYSCANPDGPVSNSDCPEDDIFCNCPAKELIPKDESIVDIESFLRGLQEPLGNESTGIYYELNSALSNGDNFAIVKGLTGENFGKYELVSTHDDYDDAKADFLELPYSVPKEAKLDELLKKTKECDLIEEHLGSEYLGCIWEDPNGSLSCNCPNVSPKFYEYLKYNRTLSTFWETPEYTPLYRRAQIALLQTQVIKISVTGNLNIKPGQIIFCDFKGARILDEQGTSTTEGENRTDIFDSDTNSKFHGKWLVSQVDHKISGTSLHKMVLTLVRDSLPIS